MIRGIRRLFHLAVRPFRGRVAIDQEIAGHLDMTIDDLVRRGWTREAAAAEAARRFGDLRGYREALMTIEEKAQRRLLRRGWLADLIGDLHQVARGLRQSPAFTLGVGLTLTLGIGMNAAMIGLVDQLLFKPPAHVREPDRVVRYTLTQTFAGYGSFTNEGVTWKEVGLLATQATRLEQVAAIAGGQASLGRGENARSVPFQIATENYFSLLGVTPAIGRFFGPGEDPIDGSATAAVISYRMWSRDFGRRPDALGRELWLGSQHFIVVGVAPKYFNGVDLDATDVWLPFNAGSKLLVGSGDWRNAWGWQWVRIVGRLKEGFSREQASVEATAHYRAAVADVPDLKNDNGTVTLQPVIAARGANRSKEPVVAALLAGVSILLLLITCANVANLLLARGLARRREIAVRLALGIGRRRLIRLLLGEGLLLAGIGALGGVALAYLGGTLIRRLFLPNIDFVAPPFDARLLAVTIVVALLSAGLIALAPAVRMSRPDLTIELKSGGGGQAGGGRHHHRLRRGLLLTQGALSAVMLTCAGLFVKSFARVAAVDFGFRPDGLLVANIDLHEAGYQRPQQIEFYDEAYRRLASFPGVRSVSLATANPFSTRYGIRVRIPGRDSVPRLPSGGASYSAVTPDYFQTLGIPLKSGRGFTQLDRDGSPDVLVLNETMARTYWPGEEALGKCLVIGDAVKECREVVGIVGDANSESLELTPKLFYYIPLGQARDLTRDRNLFFRVAGDPIALINPLRRAIQTLAPNLPVANVALLRSQMDGLYRPWRLGAALFAVMGAIALAVVLVGLYSVLSYAVAQRRREFGIRTALGATTTNVVGLVVREGQRTIVVGLVVGLATAMVASQWLGRFLFKTSPRDPLVLGLVVAVLIVATAVGSLVPAWRASRVDPAATLRSE